MSDHPAIVVLAKELWQMSCIDVLNRRMVNMGEWDEQGPDVQRGFLSLSRVAYAFMLGDLMEPSEAMETAWENCVNGTRGQRYRAMLRARAREVEVEVE